MRTSKVVRLVFGIIALVIAIPLALAGGALTWFHVVERDDDGWYQSDSGRFRSPTYAITSEELDLGAGVHDGDIGPFDDIGDVRITVTGDDGRGVFVGIGRSSAVDAYLAESAHDEVRDLDLDPFEPSYQRRRGEVPPGAPGAQDIWVASAAGTGTQTVEWDVGSGRWSVVVMNSDGAPGVSVDASAGIKTGILLPIGLALLVVAALLAGVATWLIAGALSGSAAAAPVPHDEPAATSSPGSPVRLWGRPHEHLSRGLWLVKWFLAIPHLLLLALLWPLFVVATVIAGVAILFTGRYPRRLFELNVGILRWTWRVTFYAFALGTDRYPPFSLRSDEDYPAGLEVDEPDSLSRGLVLVKWWLLALPHYLIISLFGGAFWTTWGSGDGRALAGWGLIGLLALVAGCSLLFVGRYPRSVFDFIMGMERWVYRVLVYAALLRDEYPPFRMDLGGADPPAPWSPVPGPHPTSPPQGFAV